jgi:hypothetical protein
MAILSTNRPSEFGGGTPAATACFVSVAARRRGAGVEARSILATRSLVPPPPIRREPLECGGSAAAFAIENASRSALAPVARRGQTRGIHRIPGCLHFHRPHYPPLAVILRSAATKDDLFFASVHVVFPTESPFSARRGISLRFSLLAATNHRNCHLLFSLT